MKNIEEILEAKKQEKKQEKERLDQLDYQFEKVVENHKKENLVESNEELRKKSERLYAKSKAQSKIEIHGELYSGKDITQKKRNNILKYILAILAFITAYKGAIDLNLLSEYKAKEKDIIKEANLSEEELKRFDKGNILDVIEINKVAHENRKDYQFITGDRKDGTHNPDKDEDPDRLIAATDKQLDAMDQILEERVAQVRK